MKLFTALATLLSLSTSVYALPSSRLEARQNAPNDNGVDTRAYRINGAVRTRQELNSIIGTNLWPVYINGLYNWMNRDSKDTMSYYAIAGIHGSALTYVSGNGAYCVHNTPQFGPWHRPYLALYEVALYRECAAWVNSLTNQADRVKYTAALNQFSIPYWDWSVSQNLPSVLTSPTITIFRSSARPGGESIANPLYSYKRKANVDNRNQVSLTSNTQQTIETVRFPGRDRNGAFTSQPSRVNTYLGTAYSNNRNTLLTMFKNTKDWNTMSSQLEGCHGSIHVNVGADTSMGAATQGHMYRISHAGFDPVFWLHHCNVDRLMAIWQEINPRTYLSQGSTYYPFAYTSTVHNGNNARYTRNYNYVYPETSNPNSGLQQQMISKYFQNSPASAIKQSTGIAVNKRQDAPQNGNNTVAPATPNTDLSTPADVSKLVEVGKSNLLNTTNTFNDYRLNITFPSSATSGPFSIRIFVGDYTPDSTQWVLDPNYVGSMDVFTPGNTMKEVTQITGTVQLTQAVQNLITRAKNGLDDMKVPNVRPFLRKNVHWEIAAGSGITVDKSKIRIKGETAQAIPSTSESMEQKWRTIFTLA